MKRLTLKQRHALQLVVKQSRQRALQERRSLQVWATHRVKKCDGDLLLKVYKEQVALLREAGRTDAPDKVKMMLVGRVFSMRMELKRRHIIKETHWPEGV